jgi:serine protease Do
MSVARLLIVAVAATLPVVISGQGYTRPKVPLAGLKYVRVHPLTTGDSRARGYDLPNYLQQLMAKQGWVILSDSEDLFRADAREKASQTVLCVLDIDYSGFGTRARLKCDDVLGNELFTVSETGVALLEEGELKAAVRNVATVIQLQRKTFDPRQTVDILTRLPAAETHALSEAALNQMIDSGKLTAPVTGLWVAANESGYRVGIVPTDGGPDFLVVILESPRTYLWQPGMVKARLTPAADGETFAARWRGVDRREMSGLGLVRGGLLTLTLTADGKNQTVNFIKLRPATSGSVPGTMRRTSGTGFVCAPGIVATNHHVVDGAKEIEFRLPLQNRSITLEVVLSDPTNDIALLRVADSREQLPPPLPLIDSNDVRLATQAFVVGFPLGETLGSGHKVTSGLVSGLDGLKGDPRELQLTAPVQPGSSGSPVFDSAGRVIGVVTSSLDSITALKVSGDIPQNVNFALKTEYVTLLLKRLPSVGGAQAPLKATEVQIPEMIERVRASVGQVRVVR